MVIWITGLSGAGKSSISKVLETRLRERGSVLARLDGDEVRRIINDPHTAHDRESRLRNAYRISRMAAFLESQEILTLVATMSLHKEIHQWNRANFQQYLEVWVTADLAVLKARDGKGLYSKVERGEERHLPGIDLDYDAPQNPHLTLVNNGHDQNFEPLVDQILEVAGL